MLDAPHRPEITWDWLKKIGYYAQRHYLCILWPDGACDVYVGDDKIATFYTRREFREHADGFLIFYVEKMEQITANSDGDPNPRRSA